MIMTKQELNQKILKVMEAVVKKNPKSDLPTLLIGIGHHISNKTSSENLLKHLREIHSEIVGEIEVVEDRSTKGVF